MPDRTSGAKQAVQNMLFYYLTELINEPDPKQIIASEMGAMIDLSEDQLNYVKMQLSTKNKVIDNLSSCIELLDHMITSNKIDIESLNIVIRVLSLMKDACSATLDSFDLNFEEEENDEQQSE